MSSVGGVSLKREVLRESGDRELEVLVFDVAEQMFGMDVARVREILPAPEITRLPHAQHVIRGVFQLRGQVVPCVSLADFLGIEPTRGKDVERTLILTDFNQRPTAFLVDRIERIHRLDWERVFSAPGSTLPEEMPVTDQASGGGRRIVMLDFHAIVDRITEQYFQALQAIEVAAEASPLDEVARFARPASRVGRAIGAARPIS
ncbi:MAG: chemotaxis protein CheW [Pirellulales bacterium]